MPFFNGMTTKTLVQSFPRETLHESGLVVKLSLANIPINSKRLKQTYRSGSIPATRSLSYSGAAKFMDKVSHQAIESLADRCNLGIGRDMDQERRGLEVLHDRIPRITVNS
jgi:hypothetical protein